MALAFLVIKLPCNLCVWFSEVEVIAFFLGWGGGDCCFCGRLEFVGVR